MYDGNEIVTAQQSVVLDLWCSGLTKKEVAVQLDLSFKTIDAHILRVQRKTGKTSHALRCWWIKKRIIEYFAR